MSANGAPRDPSTLSVNFAPGAAVLADDLSILSRSVLTILREVTLAYTGKQSKWKLAGLGLQSITMAVSPQESSAEDPTYGKELEVSAVIVEGLQRIEEAAQRPPFFSSIALKAAERIIKASAGRGLLVGTETPTVSLSNRASRNIREVLAPRGRHLGSVNGFLDTLSVHRGTQLTVFSKSGAVVNCKISPELLDRAKDLLGARVVVFGMVTANSNGDALWVDTEDLFADPVPFKRKPVSAFFGSIPDMLEGQSISEFLENRWSADA